jgi:N-acyl-D-aspartate/D-glutamate deacylase
MGEAAVGESASAEQIDMMRAHVADALDAGALGFSSSNARTHHDGAGDPVPSRFADDRELLALCGVLANHPGTSLEYIPATAADEAERMAAMSLAAGRPLNWNLLVVVAARRAAYERDLAASDRAAEVGASVAALTLPMPMEMRIDLRNGFMLDSLPGWQDVMRLPVPERCVALRDPAVRARLRQGAINAGPRRAELTDWASHLVCETRSSTNAGLAGRTVGALARERGADAFDTLLDVALADDLATVLLPPSIGTDDESWAQRARVWRDPRAILGGSDAGAHLDMLTAFTYPTRVLSEAVRARELLRFEEAIQLMCERPARFYGLEGRGRIARGAHADLVVLDPDRVGSGPVETHHDLPAGAGRLGADAIGIEHVIVNGTPVAAHGKLTGDRPGTLLRAGRDTAPLTIPRDR